MSISKQSVLINFLWRLAERVGAQAVQFIVSIILARILAPETYGTVALVSVFITILQVLIDNGLGNSLIQKKDADNLDFSTVFFANIIFCIILYTLLFFCAPLISTFYNDESLTTITRILGLTIIISGIKNIQQAYVAKKMMFKKFFLSTIGGTIIAAVVGIYMALNNYGIWALAAQQLINTTIDTIILWMTVKWRPKFIFSFQRLRTLFTYGWKLLVSALFDSLYNNIQQLLIGRIYNSDELAYYNRGRTLPELVIQNVNTSVDSVIFPTMSDSQNNITKIKAITSRTIKLSTFIIAPITIGMAFTANHLISVLLTDKWLPCVPFLIVFAISYTFWPIHTANLNAIKSLGYSNIFLKLEIVKKTIGFLILIITINISPLAIAVGLMISDAISQIINTYPNRKLLQYGYFAQLKDILPNILLALFMGIVVYSVNSLNLSSIVTLAIQVTVGAIIYIGGAAMLKIDSFLYLKQAISSFLSRRKHA